MFIHAYLIASIPIKSSMNKNALVKHSAINMISYRIEEEQEEKKKN
jgi:hypothetical protein